MQEFHGKSSVSSYTIFRRALDFRHAYLYFTFGNINKPDDDTINTFHLTPYLELICNLLLLSSRRRPILSSDEAKTAVLFADETRLHRYNMEGVRYLERKGLASHANLPEFKAPPAATASEW